MGKRKLIPEAVAGYYGPPDPHSLRETADRFGATHEAVRKILIECYPGVLRPWGRRTIPSKPTKQQAEAAARRRNIRLRYVLEGCSGLTQRKAASRLGVSVGSLQRALWEGWEDDRRGAAS